MVNTAVTTALNAYASCLRCFLLILNCMYLVFGLFTIGVALVCIQLNDQYMNYLGNKDYVGQYSTAIVLILGRGVVAVFLSLVGCCGVIFKYTSALVTCAAIMGGLLVTEHRSEVEIWNLFVN